MNNPVQMSLRMMARKHATLVVMHLPFYIMFMHSNSISKTFCFTMSAEYIECIIYLLLSTCLYLQTLVSNHYWSLRTMLHMSPGGVVLWCVWRHCGINWSKRRPRESQTLSMLQQVVKASPRLSCWSLVWNALFLTCSICSLKAPSRLSDESVGLLESLIVQCDHSADHVMQWCCLSVCPIQARQSTLEGLCTPIIAGRWQKLFGR